MLGFHVHHLLQQDMHIGNNWLKSPEDDTCQPSYSFHRSQHVALHLHWFALTMRCGRAKTRQESAKEILDRNRSDMRTRKTIVITTNCWSLQVCEDQTEFMTEKMHHSKMDHLSSQKGKCSWRAYQRPFHFRVGLRLPFHSSSPFLPCTSARARDITLYVSYIRFFMRDFGVFCHNMMLPRSMCSWKEPTQF